MVKRGERWICSASEAALGDYDDDVNHIIEQIHGEVYDSDDYDDERTESQKERSRRPMARSGGKKAGNRGLSLIGDFDDKTSPTMLLWRGKASTVLHLKIGKTDCSFVGLLLVQP